MNNNPPAPINRRTFIATTAAAGTLTLLKPGTVFSAEANSTIEIGLIGCGGRGKWIADLFAQTGKYKFVACADYFQDKADAVGDQHKIETARR